MSASKNNERPTKKGRKMNTNATFEKINNNVVVKCTETRYAYNYQITHQKQTFSLLVMKSLSFVDVCGRGVKIDVERHRDNAYISIKHNRVTLGQINLPAPEKWFYGTCSVDWYNVNDKLYHIELF